MGTRKKHAKTIEVTSETFGELLVQSAAEAAAIAQGELPPAAVRTVTIRDVGAIPQPPEYSPTEIRGIRLGLNLSQPVFAQVLSTSVHTLQSWEQGRRAPDMMGRRLLQVAHEQPRALLNIST